MAYSCYSTAVLKMLAIYSEVLENWKIANREKSYAHFSEFTISMVNKTITRKVNTRKLNTRKLNTRKLNTF